MATCNQTIAFNTAFTSERQRGFQPPWYTVFLYKCPSCGAIHRMKKSYHGPTPMGAFVCGVSKKE